MCEKPHDIVFIDIYVDGAKRVANALDLGGVVQHGHVFLVYVFQLLSELKLACRRVRGENLLEIYSRLFGRLGVLNVTKHVVLDTCCQEIDYPTHSLLPRWVVGVCNFGFLFECTGDVAPIPLADKVLVHLVLPR